MASRSKWKSGLQSIGLMTGEDIKEVKADMGSTIRVHQFPPLRRVPQADGWIALAALEAIAIAGLTAYCWFKYFTM
jgi:hypothetical protein